MIRTNHSAKHPPILRSLLLLIALAAFSGCASIPFLGRDKNRERPCEYREVYAVATVKSAGDGKVHFLVGGSREVVLDRNDLPDNFSFHENARFQVRQKFLTSGNCAPYVMEIVGLL